MKLLPCPFCGEKANKITKEPHFCSGTDDNWYPQTTIYCTKCGATIQRTNDQEAEDAWNDRVEPDDRYDE